MPDSESGDDRVIFGVDLGTRRIAVASADHSYLVELSLEGARSKRQFPQETDAGSELGRWVSEQLAPFGYGGHHFFVERPVTLRGRKQNIRTAVGQGLSAGAVISYLPGVTHVVENSQWKLEVVGNGHADKAEVRRWLEDRQPALAALCAGSEDGADAFCLSLYGQAALAQAGGL